MFFLQESHKILGNTFGMCVLQDFESITPNVLARTIETVEGGGCILLLLKSMSSLRQLYTMTMDVHARLRTSTQREVTGRFVERFILSLGSCPACLVCDEELNILPISTHIRTIVALPPQIDARSPKQRELDQLQASMADTEMIGALIKKARTLDQAKVFLKKKKKGKFIYFLFLTEHERPCSFLLKPLLKRLFERPLRSRLLVVEERFDLRSVVFLFCLTKKCLLECCFGTCCGVCCWYGLFQHFCQFSASRELENFFRVSVSRIRRAGIQGASRLRFVDIDQSRLWSWIHCSGQRVSLSSTNCSVRFCFYSVLVELTFEKIHSSFGGCKRSWTRRVGGD